MKETNAKALKDNRGITLIALIITIVVMLILLSYGIKYAINSNLIGDAEKTVKATNEKEKEQLEQAELLLGKIDDIEKQQQINACGEHNWVDDKVITEATCTTAGSKSQKCSKCPATRTVETPTIEHNYVNGTCTVCGEKF